MCYISLRNTPKKMIYTRNPDMIVRYNNFDESESIMEKEEYLGHIDIIENHIEVMEIEGKSREEINEDLSNIFSALGGGFKQKIYQYAAEWLLGRMGLPTEGVFMEIAIQIITKIKFYEITSYFGKGSCKKWTEAIIEGLEYWLVNKLADYAAGAIYGPAGSKSTRNGVLETLIGTIGNAAAGGLHNTQVVQKIEKAIEGTLCGDKAPGFSDIFKGKLQPQEKEKLASQIHQGAKDDPSIMGQIKSIGLLDNLFGNKS